MLTCSGWQGRWQVPHLSLANDDRETRHLRQLHDTLTSRTGVGSESVRRRRSGTGSISGPFWLKPKWLGFRSPPTRTHYNWLSWVQGWIWQSPPRHKVKSLPQRSSLPVIKAVCQGKGPACISAYVGLQWVGLLGPSSARTHRWLREEFRTVSCG